MAVRRVIVMLFPCWYYYYYHYYDCDCGICTCFPCAVLNWRAICVWLILWPPPPWGGLFRSIFPGHVPNGCGTKKFVFVLMQFRDRTTPMACNFLLQGLCVWQGNRFPPTARSHHVGSYRCTNMQRIHHSRSREPRLPVLSSHSRLMHDFQVHQGRVSSEIITSG